MLTALPLCEVAIDCEIPGLPGWIRSTRITPRTAFSKDVSMKYTKVRTAIIPFILAFKLAEPETTTLLFPFAYGVLLQTRRFICVTGYKAGDHQGQDH